MYWLWQKTIYRKAFKDQKNLKIALTLNSLGVFYFLSEKHIEALEYVEESLAVAKDLRLHNQNNNDIQLCIADSFNSMGGIHQKFGKYRKALLKFEEALSMNRNIFGNDYSESIANNIMNIGICHRMLGENNQSIYNLKKSLEIRIEIFSNDLEKFKIADCLINLGLVHEKMGNFDEAFENYKKSLTLATQGNLSISRISLTLEKISDLIANLLNKNNVLYNQI